MAPPKKSTAATKQAKTELKKKEKVVEDRTFGLKNKNKSKSVQKYIKGLHEASKQSMKKQVTLLEKTKEERMKEKEAKRNKDDEIGMLFKSVQREAKVGQNPKTIVCEYFRQGKCKKGDKCRFSHDLKVERRVVKIDLYSDPRDCKEDPTMADWDQEKLEAVVAAKSMEPANQTDIICKYFLEAIEKRQYGFFWSCPNGAGCQYRHALPLGFVLKEKDKTTAIDPDDETSLEEQLEEERAKVASSTNLTPCTKENLQAWLEKRNKDAYAAKKRKVAASKKANLSGKDLFTFDPALFRSQLDLEDEEEDEAFDFNMVEREVDDDEDEQKAIAKQWADDSPNIVVEDIPVNASLFMDDVDIPDSEDDD